MPRSPDWSAYIQNSATIPSRCADSTAPAPITAHPTVTVFDPAFRAPHVWRASLGAQHRLFSGYTLSINTSYSRGEAQYGVRDANLGAAQFGLPAEEGRSVFVPPSAIDTSSGLTSVDASHRVPGAGKVLVVGSDLQSDSKMSFGGLSFHGMTLQTSYTWTRARDQSSFNCRSASQGFAAATTAGDPNVRESATSDFERHHALLATVTYPIGQSLELTAIGRLNSGVPFTPLVGSDINGDGARNDRAYVFDPATTGDSAVAQEMARLLAGAPGRVRGCLVRQEGTVAARNSCTGPWQGSLLGSPPDDLALDRELSGRARRAAAWVSAPARVGSVGGAGCDVAVRARVRPGDLGIPLCRQRPLRRTPLRRAGHHGAVPAGDPGPSSWDRRWQGSHGSAAVVAVGGAGRVVARGVPGRRAVPSSPTVLPRPCQTRSP